MGELVNGSVSRVYQKGTAPFVRAFLRLGVTPNTLTTIGALLIALSAVAYGMDHIRSGGALLLASGILDTLDGQVARSSDRATKWGAFYDSTLDRMGDGALFIGIAAYLIYAPGVRAREFAVILCMVGILSALLVSYMRARAEGLGLECRVGIAQRAERILGLGLSTLILGAGPGGLVLTIVVGILTGLSLITVGQRFVYVHRVAGDAGIP